LGRESLGASVNGKPTVSKTVTAGSTPAAPVEKHREGMKFIQKPVGFIKEVKVELGKVAWSTRRELIDSTVVVIVVTALMAGFIGLIDIMLSKGLSQLLR
jgi:preprotein translocase subunit SecE